MAERSGFFNAKPMVDELMNPVYHEDGNIKYDREYNASEFAAVIGMLLTNGIRNGGTNLKVMAYGGGMDIKVLPGDAIIEGYFYKLMDQEAVLKIKAPTGFTRCDRVVLRLDLRQEEGRSIRLDIKEGGPDGQGAKLERNNEWYELGLADITVYKDTVSIKESQIFDLRFNSFYCGLIHSLVEVDTSGLFNEIEAYLKEKKALWQEMGDDFSYWFVDTKVHYQGWFDEIKGNLWQSAYADFENWAHMSGYSYVTEVFKDRVTETIQSTATGYKLAMKETLRGQMGVTESLTFYDPLLKVQKITETIDGRIISRIEVA